MTVLAADISRFKSTDFVPFTSHYNTEYCNLQGHSSLTPICLYIHKMELRCTEWKKLIPAKIGHNVELITTNHTFRYDLLLAHLSRDLITASK